MLNKSKEVTGVNSHIKQEALCKSKTEETFILQVQV